MNPVRSFDCNCDDISSFEWNINTNTDTNDPFEDIKSSLPFSKNEIHESTEQIFNCEDYIKMLSEIKGDDDEEEEINPETTKGKKKFTVIHKMCGRKRRYLENIYKIVHSRDSIDDIERKLLNDYMNFLIDFNNLLISLFMNGDKYLKLLHFSYDAKKIVNKEAIRKNKESSIKKIILDFPISPKIKKFPKDHNKIVYEKICEKSEFMKEFLDNNFLSLFEIYYKGQNSIDLKKFGFDKEIYVQGKEVKFFKDLLAKKNIKNDKEYIQKMKQFAEENYL